MRHNLNLVDIKYRNIVIILLSHEEQLSDGYKYYSEYAYDEEAEKYYNGDYVLATLVHIAQEILGDVN